MSSDTPGDRGGRQLYRRLLSQRQLCLALGVALVSLALCGCGAKHTTASDIEKSLNFGPFAGYQEFGPVHSVSAELTVPQITQHSPPGVAATWIGAEAASPNARAPFIQVGVNEFREAGKGDVYYAFWTDTARGFIPVPLFSVDPGERLATRLALRNHRWTVSISDPTAGRHAQLATRQEGNADFRIALWIQEDPVDGLRGGFEPYPTMTGLRFAHLAADNVAPAVSRTNGQWMSQGDQVLRPTALDDDSFTVTPGAGSLSSAARRYLTSEQQLVDAGTKPLAALATTGPSTGRAERVSAARRLDVVITRSIQALRATRWPPNARSDIADSERSLQRLLNLTNQLASGPAGRFAAVHRRWASAADASIFSAAQLRISLHVPPLSPPAAELARLYTSG